MRITAGIYKGRRLFFPLNDKKLRPTSDRTKQAVFNILQDVEGFEVLDLFAGTGQLGLEAVSRGAAEVVLCDVDLRWVKKNVEHLRTDNHGQCKIILFENNYMIALRRCAAKMKKFDLIFLDPPYDGPIGVDAVNQIIKHGCLKKDAKIILEHSGNFELNNLPECAIIHSTHEYGTQRIAVLGVDYR